MLIPQPQHTIRSIARWLTSFAVTTLAFLAIIPPAHAQAAQHFALDGWSSVTTSSVSSNGRYIGMGGYRVSSDDTSHAAVQVLDSLTGAITSMPFPQTGAIWAAPERLFLSREATVAAFAATPGSGAVPETVVYQRGTGSQVLCCGTQNGTYLGRTPFGISDSGRYVATQYSTAERSPVDVLVRSDLVGSTIQGNTVIAPSLTWRATYPGTSANGIVGLSLLQDGGGAIFQTRTGVAEQTVAFRTQWSAGDEIPLDAGRYVFGESHDGLALAVGRSGSPFVIKRTDTGQEQPYAFDCSGTPVDAAAVSIADGGDLVAWADREYTDPSPGNEIYVRDLRSGSQVLVNVDNDGQRIPDISGVEISADGSTVVMTAGSPGKPKSIWWSRLPPAPFGEASCTAGTATTPGQGPGGDETGPAQQTGQAYVALGDSYSSGEGVPPFFVGTADDARNTCHRSKRAYSQLLDPARLRRATGTSNAPLFAACSGATVSDLYKRNHDNNLGEGPQKNALAPETTRLATLSIGGNDVSFADILANCINGVSPNMRSPLFQAYFKGSGCRRREAASFQNNLGKLNGSLRGRRLSDVYNDILAQMAPGAKLMVVNYPLVLGQPKRGVIVKYKRCKVGRLGLSYYFAGDDVRWLAQKTEEVNEVIRKEVARARSRVPRQRHQSIRVVDAATAFEGHGICETHAANQWFNPLILDIKYADFGVPYGGGPSPYSFHPNGTGQRKLASAVNAALPK